MQPSDTSPSAYRSIGERAEDDGERDDAFRERMHPVFVLVWIASLARVVGAVYEREVLGAEATLALMTLVALSWYAYAARAGHRSTG
jgi:hypothetical protein